MKSPKNKTIDLDLVRGEEFLKNCLTETELDVCPQNATVIGDTFSVVNKIKDCSVDLAIIDPPYNLNKNFHGEKFKKTNFSDYKSFTEKWITAILPKLKPNATVYVCCDWQSSMVIAPVLLNFFNVRNRITWGREKGRGAKANWKNSLEDVFYCTVGEDFTFNLDAVKQRKKVLAPYKESGKPKDWQQTEDGKFRDTCPSNFWDDISVPYWSMPENTAHPTQKPEKLIAKLVLASSNAGDLVLDPFAGSGTTAVVCKKLGRNYIGIEQNPIYCVWAEKRLSDAETNKTIQGYEDGVFWERNSKPLKK